MNGVVACTLLQISTNQSCILRLYKSSKKLPESADSGGIFGEWDWLGGSFRPQEKNIYYGNKKNSGLWRITKSFKPEALLLGAFSYSSDFRIKNVFAILANVPTNFLDIGPDETVRGSGEHPDIGAINWSIWFRAS